MNQFLTKKEGQKRLKICKKCEHYEDVPVLYLYIKSQNKLYHIVQSFASSSTSFNDDTVDDMMVDDETHPAIQTMIDQDFQKSPAISSAKKKYNPYM